MKKVMLGMTLALLMLGCSEPDHGAATAAFRECLARSGVEVQDLDVRIDSNGQVESIEVTIVSEAGAAYEPVVRLACTEEVNNR